MGVMSFLSNIAETKELHSVIELRSRYYKTNYRKAKAVITEYVKKINAKVKKIDDVYKEIFIQGSNFHIIVSIVQVSPIETAIDLKVEQYGLAGFNRPVKKINDFYAYLNKELDFCANSSYF